MSKSFFFFLLSLFLFSSGEAAATKNIIFNHIGSKELGNASVLGMVRDDLGFTWLATSNGLCKYDGASFRFIRHNPDDTASLENNSVNDIIKDENGKLWLGVDGAGIYEFDPYTEKLIQYKNHFKPIATNRIRHLINDGDDIYIATYGGGLTIFHKSTKTFSNYLHDDKDSSSIANGIIFQFAKDRKGNLWLGLALAGLDEFNTKTKKFTHHNLFSNEAGDHYVSNVLVYDNNCLLLGTSHGLIRYWPATRKQVRYVHDEKFPGSLGNTDVCVMLSLPDGRILITHPSGLDITDSTFREFKHYRNDPVNPYSISETRYRNFILSDSTGTIWFGSQHSGLDVIYPEVISPKTWKHDSANPNTVVSDDVFSIYEDQYGVLWLGTYGEGASRFERTSNTFTNYTVSPGDTTSISDGLVYSFFREDASYCWLLTENGMDKLNTTSNKVEQRLFLIRDQDKAGYDKIHRTCQVLRDSLGNYWIGIIQGGLLYYEPATGKITRYRHDDKDIHSLSDNRIFSMAYDKKNKLIWIGTANGGLNAFDPATQRFTSFMHDKKNPGSLTHDWITTLQIDSTTGMLWIGTDGGGLNALNLNKLPADRSKAVFFHYTDMNGLPDNRIQAVLPDGKGNVWLAHEQFLCRFTPGDGLHSKSVCKIYHVANGLPFEGASQYGLLLSAKDHRLYVGGEGFYSFNPDSIRENKIPPAVYITGLSLFGKPYSSDTSILFKKTITLPYNQNFISFQFAVLNYIFPGKSQVAWKLEGLDEEWTTGSNQQSANYTNLDPGTYVFHVRGANNDGYWNEKGAVITIIITPPFWKTGWFYALIIVLLLAGIFFYGKWREQKLQKAKKILESTVTERTSQLKNAYSVIEEKNKDITDSINYARKIQDAILPSDKEFSQLLPQSFVLYKPKDIVSGDFYWLTKKDNKIVFAAVDCTGHGVPGAFMSLIGHTLLNEIVNEEGVTSPSLVLDKMRSGVIRILKQKGIAGENKDGMDISLCTLDCTTLALQFSGAHNPLWIIRNRKDEEGKNRLEEIKPDKQPIGIAYGEPKPFTLHSLQLERNDSIYIFTDGYADQFGGPRGKKFKYKALQELILHNCNKAMPEQHAVLQQTLEDWKKDLEQNDDILLIGVRV